MVLEKKPCPRCSKESYLFRDEEPCYSCREKDKLEKLSKEVKKDGKSSYEDYIMCPYCGENYGEDEMHTSTEVTCCYCDKDFAVEVEYSVHYSTNKIKQKNSS